MSITWQTGYLSNIDTTEIKNYISDVSGDTLERVSLGQDYFENNYGRYCIGLDGTKIVASMNYTPAIRFPELTGNEALCVAIDDAGSDILNCDCPAEVWVHEDYRDQNLSNIMIHHRATHAIADGYTHGVWWQYATQAIYDYGMSKSGVIKFEDIPDGFGRHFAIIPLSVSLIT